MRVMKTLQMGLIENPGPFQYAIFLNRVWLLEQLVPSIKIVSVRIRVPLGPSDAFKPHSELKW